MKVSAMIRAGFTAERACDKMYSVHQARLPITRIISAMIRDKTDGGHPELRVIKD